MNLNVIYGFAAAFLFGASTPFVKLLVGDEAPVMLAGLLYLGSGIGLTLIRLGNICTTPSQTLTA
jgi:hypothetical protein